MAKPANSGCLGCLGLIAAIFFCGIIGSVLNGNSRKPSYETYYPMTYPSPGATVMESTPAPIPTPVSATTDIPPGAARSVKRPRTKQLDALVNELVPRGSSGANETRTSKSYRRSSSSSGYITGPRGGCYYINSNGNKTYVDRSLCGTSQSFSGSSTRSRGGYITGPRGGCYYINGNGNKTYVDRSLCR